MNDARNGDLMKRADAARYTRRELLRRGAWLGLSAPAIVTLGTARSNAAPAARDLSQVTVVGGVPNIPVTFAPFMTVPKYLGFFAEEGLDVHVQATNGAPAALQQMLSGKAQFTTHSVAALYAIREKGARVKAFFNNIPTNFQYPVVLADSPITSIKDAAGKTIGVNALNSGPHVVVQAMLRTAAVDPKSVTFVEVGTGAPALLALKNRKIDILGLWESQYIIFQAQGAQLRELLDPPARTIGFQHGTFTTDEMLAKSAKIVAGFGRATAKGMLWTYYNPDAAIRIHWELIPTSKPTGMSAEAAFGANRKDMIAWGNRARPAERFETFTEPIGGVRPGEVEEVRDLLLKAGLIKKALDVGEYFDSSQTAAINDFDKPAIVKQAKAFQYRPK